MGMPWSRSATTVRNAPALGFKQQYAIGEPEEIEKSESVAEIDAPDVQGEIDEAAQKLNETESLSHAEMEAVVGDVVEEVNAADEAATAQLNDALDELSKAV